MAVVLTRACSGGERAGQPCAMCTAPVTFPYVQWGHFGGSLLICNKCCGQPRRGLIADMIQVDATAAMQQQWDHQYVLVRMERTKVYEKERAAHGIPTLPSAENAQLAEDVLASIRKNK